MTRPRVICRIAASVDGRIVVDGSPAPANVRREYEVMVPVAWGLSDLAPHGWAEPMERVLVTARAVGVRVARPRPRHKVESAVVGPAERWRPVLPWRTGDEALVWSTSVHMPGRAAGARVEDGGSAASVP
jgi:hypothetical protein